MGFGFPTGYPGSVTDNNITTEHIGGSKGSASLRPKIFPISCIFFFFGKFDKTICWRTLPRRIGAPSYGVSRIPSQEQIVYFISLRSLTLTVSPIRTTIRQEREHAAVVEQRDDQQVPTARAVHCGPVRQLQARAIRTSGQSRVHLLSARISTFLYQLVFGICIHANID